MSTNYKQWIQAMADLQGGRPFFSDQTPGSLELIGKLAQTFSPSLIVEMGTNYGLSLRRWREAVPETPVVAIDASFNPLRSGLESLPVDLSTVTLIEKMTHDVNLPGLWEKASEFPQKGVLLYVDVHSDHHNILEAVKTLPNGSIVVFDDVWRCEGPLVTDSQKEAFFKAYVFPQVDQTAPMEIMPRSYSDYWKGGGFWGFDEVPIICEWAKANKTTLHWEPFVKVVWFQWPQDTQTL